MLQSLAAIIILFGFTRLLGKRQLTQLTFFEYIVGITIGNLAGFISVDLEGNWHYGFVALTVWIIISLIIEFTQIKSKKVRDFIDSRSTFLIQDGKVLEDSLKKERISNEELISLLRKKQVFKVEQVDYAIMEPSGEVNVQLKKQYQPVTLSDLNQYPQSEGITYEIIMDGKIMNESLMATGFSTRWLNRKLKEKGTKIQDVFLAQLDKSGNLYIDLYDDNI